MRAISLLSIPFLLASLACDGATAPRRYGREIPITTASGQPQAAPIQSVVLGENGLTIHGQIQTPTPCYDLAAYRTDRGFDATITIVAKARGGSCAQMIASTAYTIETTGGCGTHLSIVYHYVGTGWPDNRVFDDSWGCISAH